MIYEIETEEDYQRGLKRFLEICASQKDEDELKDSIAKCFSSRDREASRAYREYFANRPGEEHVAEKNATEKQLVDEL